MLYNIFYNFFSQNLLLILYFINFAMLTKEKYNILPHSAPYLIKNILFRHEKINLHFTHLYG